MPKEAKASLGKARQLVQLLIIYFIFKHILLAQNRPESGADGSEMTESLSVTPFQVLSNWKIPDSSSLPFSDNSMSRPASGVKVFLS